MLQKKQSLLEKRAAVPFDDFVADSSEGKRISHSRLVNFLNKFGGSVVQRMYKKGSA